MFKDSYEKYIALWVGMGWDKLLDCMFSPSFTQQKVTTWDNCEKYIALWVGMGRDKLLDCMFSSSFTQHKVTKE